MHCAAVCARCVPHNCGDVAVVLGLMVAVVVAFVVVVVAADADASCEQ